MIEFLLNWFMHILQNVPETKAVIQLLTVAEQCFYDFASSFQEHIYNQSIKWNLSGSKMSQLNILLNCYWQVNCNFQACQQYFEVIYPSLFCCVYHGNYITWIAWIPPTPLNTLRPGLDGRYFGDDVLKCIFLNEIVWISLKISLKFVPKGPINNITALVQIMACSRPCDKPLSEPMLVFVPTHICVTWSQWVNALKGDKMAAIVQTIFSKSFTWIKIIVFRLKIH